MSDYLPGAESFLLRWSRDSRLTPEQALAYRVIVSCHCGDESCHGYAAIPIGCAQDYEPGGLYYLRGDRILIRAAGDTRDD